MWAVAAGLATLNRAGWNIGRVERGSLGGLFLGVPHPAQSRPERRRSSRAPELGQCLGEDFDDAAAPGRLA